MHDVERKRLAPLLIRGLKKRSKRYVLYDTAVPSLGVRVTETGHKSFILAARFPSPSGRRPYSRRLIGNAEGRGAISLADARKKAQTWLVKIGAGIDPQEELRLKQATEEAARMAALRSKRTSFAAVAEDFIETVLPHQRKGKVVERQLRREFISRWEGRPIDGITALDVTEVIRAAVKRGALHEAHNLLGVIRRLYTWAISCGAYGLEHSPCDRLKPKDVIGVGKTSRRRVLTDAELKALWTATEPQRMTYPFAPMYRLLAITGQRKSEVSDAKWGEFDLKKKLWTIPAERMKADAPHVVPLSGMALEILETLPRFSKGDHLFATTFGEKPVSGFSKAKARLDAIMLEQLGKLDPFVVHDIRRTVRTRLSAAPVEDRVRELVIGHTQRGLHKVYDQHSYLDEKRAALDWWAARLKSIVTPPPKNVVNLGRATG